MKKIIIFSIAILSVLVVTAQGKFSGGDGSGYNSVEFNTGEPLFISVATTKAIKPVKVYPNPASHVVNFEVLHYPARVEVYNSNGQLVVTNAITQHLHTMQVNTLQAGMYFYTVTANGKKTYGKLMVQ